MFAMDGASGYSCPSCRASFKSATGLSIHRTKKHVPSAAVAVDEVYRARKRKQSAEVVYQQAGGTADDLPQTSVQEETDERVETEYTADDFELPAGESFYYACEWDQPLFSAFEPIAAQTMDEGVVSSSLAGTVQQFPMWSQLNLAATELAMYGRVPALDLVASGHLTVEESAISLWGQQYNISLSAQDSLHSIITALDVNGRPTFDVSNLSKTEVQRRKVVDSQVPAHQRTARGNLFTEATCAEQLMRRNVVIDSRHVPSIAIELLQEYEAHVDFELKPHYDKQKVRLFNEHFGSGDRAFRLNTALHEIDPGGFVVGLQFHSNKTAYGSKESLWPMYLTVFNIFSDSGSTGEEPENGTQVAVETILAASYFIQDFATSDCYYVADTTFYYRYICICTANSN